uniref:PPUP113 n=1 Tax=Poeciliopsis prolifica TaxID=188132 RepID=A0A0S7ES13_9TELE
MAHFFNTVQTSYVQPVKMEGLNTFGHLIHFSFYNSSNPVLTRLILERLLQNSQQKIHNFCPCRKKNYSLVFITTYLIVIRYSNNMLQNSLQKSSVCTLMFLN